MKEEFRQLDKGDAHPFRKRLKTCYDFPGLEVPSLASIVRAMMVHAFFLDLFKIHSRYNNLLGKGGELFTINN